MPEISNPVFDSLPPVKLVRRRYWPVATITLIALCVIVYILEGLAGGSKNIQVLLEFGASYGPYLRAGEYWRLVMPMFLHIGWLHIALNMYALWILGPLLERIYGYGRFSVIYVGSGIISSLVSAMLSRNVAAGASGAIFGVAGAMLVTGWLHKEVVPARWGRVFGRGLAILIVLNFAIDFALPHLIDIWGHAGGLAGGALLALLIPPPGREQLFSWSDRKPSQWMAMVPATVVALAMFTTASHYALSQQVTQLLEQGERFRKQGQADRAAALFRQAAGRDPADERPREAMGSLDLAGDHPQDAIREYREALKLSPDSPDAQLGLAAAFGRLGNDGEARHWLEAAVGSDPSSPAAQAALGDLCLDQKLYPEAIAHYQKALAINPNLAEVQNNLAWLLATSDDAKYRDPAASLAHALKAVDLSHGKEPSYIDTLAEAYYANGMYQQAVATQKKAVALDSGSRELRDHLAKFKKAAGS